MPETKKVIEKTPDLNAEEVRVGVYTCQCGGNISHVVQCERVGKIVGKLPNVKITRTDASLLLGYRTSHHRTGYQGTRHQPCRDRCLYPFPARTDLPQHSHSRRAEPISVPPCWAS